MHNFPEPYPDALEHSAQLRQHINNEIYAAGGALSFSRYMDLCLYAPSLGYYAVGHEKIGTAGDFITAPQVTPLFSHCVARQAQQILQQVSQGDILEFGAGTGQMASDILTYLAEQNNLPQHYFILEVSPDLQQRQEQMLRERCTEFASQVIWLREIPQCFRGVILANEVLDAMPVQRFAFFENQVYEYFVTQEKEQFKWQLISATSELKNRILQLQQHHFKDTTHYSSEISMIIPQWINSLSQCLKQGALLVIDYGFPEHEYYHPQRTMGTLMCHYQHRMHENPLVYPGLQDITSHVDFSLLANSASAAGLGILGYTTQAYFLLSCGILELIPTSPRELIRANQAIKKLTLPHEMGELFKVMALGRAIDTSLVGFKLQDLRDRL